MKSLVNAIHLCALLAYLLISPAFAGFDEGIAAYQANDLPLAYKEFRAAAEAGHVDSQYNLGLMYEKGIGVEQDETEAVTWYTKAAEQGSAFAQYNLAVLYENGRGTAVDFIKANQWYRKASVQGDALAIGNLGMLYVRGQGVDVNLIGGVALLLLSATIDSSNGNNARQNLASIRGLSTEMIDQARGLFTEMGSAKNMLEPFDQYIKQIETK